ncbi:glycosyltransferase [Nitritalea halalkaliphila LW7]|uniref:Glycosyltransferase n=1 Tax=Nitritalea halalkaliphila LW7 TaxID=1189621 RepID=I5C607_9BACT|nr:hypothetical protein [Nitritalea halalkaliphila]EIM77259.1 glycosyltransferase [Nitritalea halalkaliphila LW7]
MKILINTAHQRFGGAIQVALSFIHECKNFPENQYFVWVGQGVGKSIDVSTFPKNFHFEFFDFGEIGFSTISHIQKTCAQSRSSYSPTC